MVEEVQETLPIENTPPPTDPPVESEAASDAAAGEHVLPPESEPQVEPEPKKQPWFLQRISEESAKRSAAEQRAIDAERRARAAEELLQRERPEQRTAPPPPSIDEQSHREEIRREAARQRFEDDIRDLNTAGLQAYGVDFDNAVNVLASVTGQGDPLFEFVSDVMSIDKANAHALLHMLGTKPEEAAIFARIDSKQRIAALTRMSMTTAPEPKTAPAPATKQVSKAPAPAPALQPTAHKTINFQSPESDKLTDKEFFAQLDAHMETAKRTARR